MDIKEEMQNYSKIYNEYADKVRTAYEAVVYTNEKGNIFNIVWQRTPYSKYQELAFIYVNNEHFNIIQNNALYHVDNVVVCTPESSYELMKSIYDGFEKAYMIQKYKEYKRRQENDNP